MIDKNYLTNELLKVAKNANSNLNDSDKRAYLEKLLNAGADIHGTDDEDKTALIWASYWGNFSSLQLLINRGCNVNWHPGGLSNTALHWAARWGFLDCSAILIAHNADISVMNLNGKTPLDIATGCRCPDIINLLTSAQEKVDLLHYVSLAPEANKSNLNILF